MFTFPIFLWMSWFIMTLCLHYGPCKDHTLWLVIMPLSLLMYMFLFISLFSPPCNLFLGKKNTTTQKQIRLFFFFCPVDFSTVCILLTASHGVGNLKAPFWRCCLSSCHSSNIPVRVNCAKPPGPWPPGGSGHTPPGPRPRWMNQSKERKESGSSVYVPDDS